MLDSDVVLWCGAVSGACLHVCWLIHRMSFVTLFISLTVPCRRLSCLLGYVIL